MKPTTMTTVAEALCGALEREGVEVLFGHPGGAILPFYDALYRAGRPRHVLVRHEQAAAHAADGYARVTGRVGVCVATSGPGATNLVTGLATALMDSVPLVAITGQVPTAVAGTEAFQETDVLGVTMSVTKHGFLLDDPATLAATIEQAFRIARSGRPGPVVVDIPKDVLASLCPPEGLPDPRRTRRRPTAVSDTRYRVPVRPGASRRPRTGRPDWPSPDRNGNGRSSSDGRRGPADAADRGVARYPGPAPTTPMERAARLLADARRPVVVAGRGVVLSETHEVLAELVRAADLPVATTLLGLDAFAATDPRCLGMPGMHGSERANRAIQAADVVLGLGLRFDDRVTGTTATFAPRAAIIHMDIDPVSVGRTVRPAVSILGDLRATLRELAARIPPARRPDWWAELRGWHRESDPNPGAVPVRGPLQARGAIRALARRIREDGAAVVTDVGQHQMWLAQELLDAPPGTHLTSGGLGTMGYALPAALGAAVSRGPGEPVWVVAGDGGFQMTLQELATVVQERLPLRIAVVNNGYLGMVRQWQELFYGRRYAATELTGPDLVRLAAAYGVAGRAVERAEDMDGALAWAAATDGPALLDLRVVREENVYPMVPAGASLDQLVPAPVPVRPS
ncbi:MAG: thiamine pyrophosphate-binding protein [Gemmatimonadota bacterium]|jgi:acetolactate synthase-1/2/3 large subunit